MSECFTDLLGDPLPSGAKQRLGTRRMQGPVVDMAYSADGEAALVITGGCLTIWNLSRGELLATHEISKADLTAMSVTRAADRLAVSDREGRLIEWHLGQNQAIGCIQTTCGDGIATVCYSPDETRLLILDREASVVEEWDLESGNRIREISREGGSFNRAVYGADGKTAFLGHQEGNNVYHYNLETRELLQVFAEDYCNYDMCLSQDGKRLFVGTRHKANEWRLDDYNCLATYTGHLGHAVPSVAYTRDDEHVLTGSRDGSIRLWDRKQAQVVRKWYPHQRHVNRMRVSPDGKWVLSYGGDQLLTESSLETGAGRLDWHRHRAGIHALVFTRDGTRLLSGSSDKTIRSWDVESWGPSGLSVDLDTEVHALAILDEDLHLAAGCKDGTVRIISFERGETVQSFPAHLGYVRAVERISNDRILTAGDDGALRIWDWRSGDDITEMTGHLGGILSLGISADGTLVATGGRDGTVCVWKLGTGELENAMRFVAHRGWVEAVTFGPDNERVFSAGRDGLVVEWNLRAECDALTLDHGSWVESIAVCDSEVISAGNDGLISVFDRETGKRVRVLTGHEGEVHTIAMAGKNLVSGSADTTMLVWALS